MSVITEVRIPSDDFELGRILSLDSTSAIELETVVPNGETVVPLFWIYGPVRNGFLETVRRHPTVNSVDKMETFGDRTLFRIDWDTSGDRLFQAISNHGGQILNATGTHKQWDFKLRFPTRESLSQCQARCEAANITLEPLRVYNPTDPETGPWYGLSDPQREALTLAVRMGYYDIPRGCSTKELANELGISDQAVTERLRRAIGAFVRHTLLTPEPES